MSEMVHSGESGGFENRLLAELEEVDRRRPFVSAPIGAGRRYGRPAVRTGWRAVGLAAAAVLVLAGAVVASGALNRPHFEAFGNLLLPGEPLGVKGDGCAAGSTVTITFDGQGFGTATASEWGAFDYSGQLPEGTSLGQHALQATCQAANGKTLAQTASVTVAESRPTVAPAIDVSGRLHPGGSVFIKGGLFAAGSPVEITLDGRPFATTTTDSRGSFMSEPVLPTETSVGAHEIGVRSTSVDGKPLTFSWTIQVSMP